jgi:hypothetical protein
LIQVKTASTKRPLPSGQDLQPPIAQRVLKHPRRFAGWQDFGGLLGFGGVQVSEAEKATLAEISSALGV